MVIPDAGGVTRKALDAYASQLSLAPDVSSVSAPGGTFVAGALVGPPSAAAAITDDSAFLTVSSRAPLFSLASDIPAGPAARYRRSDGQQVLMSGAPR